jgi:hypothetical protein
LRGGASWPMQANQYDTGCESGGISGQLLYDRAGDHDDTTCRASSTL